jgi:hypothetical protein
MDGAASRSDRGAILQYGFAKDTHEVEKMKRAFLFTTIFLLAVAAAPGVSAAPQSKGSSTLTGIVLGPDDKPVANASVSYQVSSGSAPHVVRTDARGRFTISKLRADNYDLRASGKGVFSEWEKNISLRSGATKELTLRLIYAKQIPKAYVKSSPKQ